MCLGFVKRHPVIGIPLLIVFSLISMFLIGNTWVRIDHNLNPEPCPMEQADILEHPLREFLQSSKDVLDRSGVKPGLKVLEIGPGSGYYSMKIAERMKGEGKLYALDIQQGMLDLVQKKIDEYKPATEIELVLADAYNLPFSDDFFDLVIFVTVLPEIPDQMLALKEVKRVLKSKGVVSVSEMIYDPHYPWRSTTQKKLQDSGFEDIEINGSVNAYTATAKKP